jgi:uncharacterized protein YndB with AHSA1/START domain
LPHQFKQLKIKKMEKNKVTLHRVLRASPEKVFRAFSDADAIASWLPPFGMTCKVHEKDFKVGGTFKMSFTNFTTAAGHSFGGKYLEIIPNQFIKYTDKFDDPGLSGETTTTVQLNQVSCGTELLITQTGIPDAIPAEMCYLGWQESLEKMKKLVEPNIHEF